jgi:hypothetical protein
MPSVSKKQHNFMEAIAHSPSFAKKAGVPQSVGKDFSTADKGRKFSKGGDPMASKMNPGFMAMMAKKKGAMPKMASGGKAHEDVKMDKSMMQKAVNKHEGRLHKGAPMTKLASGGSASKRADGVATKGKTKGTMVKMNMGGKAC